MKTGFTLIELSIVLVIIGLIIGGVLVGRDLIDAATVRAQISQIEKYQTAVNTFRGKYGYLPGDMPDPAATQYGFVPRGVIAGEGDGNSIIEGVNGNTYVNENDQSGGETVVFWVDLTTANLIEGGFTKAAENNWPLVVLSGSVLDQYFPAGRIKGGNYIFVYNLNSMNYYQLGNITSVGLYGKMNSAMGLTVQQAYNLDRKMDDGLPETGTVTAKYLKTTTLGVLWIQSDGGPTDTTTATPPSATSCYDDGGVTGTPRAYSLGQNAGTGKNCALSFKFQ